MNLRYPFIHSVLILFLLQQAYPQQAEEKDKIQTIDSKITAVTVYADRARVTREATLALLLYRALGSYRMDEAAVLALLLVMTCLAVFVVVEGVVGGRSRT